MSPDQRCNFAAFLAKLSAAGVANDQLCSCALIILRDTLETQRALEPADRDITTAGSERHEGRRAGIDDQQIKDRLSIAQLLPAANTWLFHAGYKIIRLSDSSTDSFPVHAGMLGELARAEGTVPENGGFSPQRWLFWLKRLEQIGWSDNGMEETQKTAEFARKIYNSVLITVTFVESAMRQELYRMGKLPLEVS